MRKIFVLAFCLIFTAIMAQDKQSLPAVALKNLKGETVMSNKFNNNGKPFVIDFWATWCKPCIQELENISVNYEDWQKMTGIKIYAISIDDSRSSKKVAPFVKGRDWQFEVMLDENSDFRRAMNVNNPPQTFIVDGNGKIVYSHNGYAPGDEHTLLEEIKKVTANAKTK